MPFPPLVSVDLPPRPSLISSGRLKNLLLESLTTNPSYPLSHSRNDFFKCLVQIQSMGKIRLAPLFWAHPGHDRVKVRDRYHPNHQLCCLQRAKGLDALLPRWKNSLHGPWLPPQKLWPKTQGSRLALQVLFERTKIDKIAGGFNALRAWKHSISKSCAIL